MTNCWRWLVLALPLVASPQTTAANPESASVVLAAVSRDDSMFVGGIGTGRRTRAGVVSIEPFARITASGKWMQIPCNFNIHDYHRPCDRFGVDYLSKRHTYTTLGAVGKGVTITAEPAKLDECWAYTGKGTYAGGVIPSAEIAASSAEFFMDASAIKALSQDKTSVVRKALSAAEIGGNAARYMRYVSVPLEGYEVVVGEQSFADYVSRPEVDSLHSVFVIGTMEPKQFKIGYVKKEEDENERVVGSIRLKSGRDFLITTVSDPESQRFRVYGIRGGAVKLVFEGGGASC
jgi:hypothetical protein